MIYIPDSSANRRAAQATENAGTVERTKFFDVNVASCLPVLGAAFALIAALVHLVMAAGHAFAGHGDKARSALKWAGFRGCDVLTNIGVTVGFAVVLGWMLLSSERKTVTVTSSNMFGATRTDTVTGHGTTTWS